jgi:D-alanyl-lipoteichoic acid acyltransferase DltB (MBOAT superfamily)
MAYKPEYGLLLLGITIIDYWAGLAIGRAEHPGRRQLYLVVSMIANLGILFIFKYFDFVFSSLATAINLVGTAPVFPVLDLILPIGISFHIFQSMSYTIEVYRKKFEPVTHFGKYALYVCFFPQLAAGPIERPQGLLRQFIEPREFTLQAARSGTKLMAWGFFKKIVIADNLAPLVDAVYSEPSDFPGPSLVIATVLFAYQIYCDFSGYTDIARGSARIFGYELIPNFNRPFHAISIADFWRRWHMSLTNWLRDYLYTPLVFSGRRVTPVRIYWSLFATLVLIGLWHGANWTYVIFGALHGVYLVLESIASRAKWFFGEPVVQPGVVPRVSVVRHLTVFGLVCLSYVFFRSETVTDAWYVVSHVGTDIPFFFESLRSYEGFTHVVLMNTSLFGPFNSIGGILTGVFGILVMEYVEGQHARGKLVAKISRVSRPTRLALYASGVFVILLCGGFTVPSQFIYFQF